MVYDWRGDRSFRLIDLDHSAFGALPTTNCTGTVVTNSGGTPGDLPIFVGTTGYTTCEIENSTIFQTSAGVGIVAT